MKKILILLLLVWAGSPKGYGQKSQIKYSLSFDFGIPTNYGKEYIPYFEDLSREPIIVSKKNELQDYSLSFTANKKFFKNIYWSAGLSIYNRNYMANAEDFVNINYRIQYDRLKLIKTHRVYYLDLTVVAGLGWTFYERHALELDLTPNYFVQYKIYKDTWLDETTTYHKRIDWLTFDSTYIIYKLSYKYLFTKKLGTQATFKLRSKTVYFGAGLSFII